MTCTDGIYIGDRRIEAGDCSGPRSARAILLNPKVEAAVLECARGGILREGLGFDRCKVAVVMNIGEGDHLGLAEMHTPEDLIKVKRVPVDVVLPDGYAVLKADDPLVAGMAEFCKGKVIYFARDPSDPVLSAHRRGGRPGRLRPRRGDRAGRGPARGGPGPARRRAADLRRPGRLPGRERPGRRRGMLGPGPAARGDPRRPGLIRQRPGSDPRPFQRADGRRRDRHPRLRAQPLGDARARRVAAGLPRRAADRSCSRPTAIAATRSSSARLESWPTPSTR